MAPRWPKISGASFLDGLVGIRGGASCSPGSLRGDWHLGSRNYAAKMARCTPPVKGRVRSDDHRAVGILTPCKKSVREPRVSGWWGYAKRQEFPFLKHPTM
eukprot:9472748-Pyramimonas_sp.AAC.1